MKSRDEIMKMISDNAILEVLLDIRDLLTSQSGSKE